MATFGAPNRLANQGEHAVRAALAMQGEAEALRRLLPADRQLAIRVGVNTGRVVVGNIGSLERMEFTVVGDAVNVAQRLESICEPGKVYVGTDTYLATRELFRYRDLGEFTLKGKQQQIRVYEVAP
jgi:class 3 adenylate cyclase